VSGALAWKTRLAVSKEASQRADRDELQEFTLTLERRIRKLPDQPGVGAHELEAVITKEAASIASALYAVMSGQVGAGEEVRVGAEPHASLGSPVGTASMPFEQAAMDGLSAREFEIVELIARGHDNREIAAKLFISEGTTRNYVSSILSKLSLKNRTQIANYYFT
jgi:DNA-binding NarL/FixJ family response regulator